uniref:Putative snoRNA binding protein n=1 Tax=Moniliophthora roreri TaxID=221103 RepID=A0A0W0FW67_MONRR
MHPFARARERTRALNAAKLDRMFAKPFIDALEGHIDAVEVLAKQPDSLTNVASGSWDGGIIVHHLSQRTQLLHLPQAHKGKVSGLCFAENSRLLSCGVDRTVKIWNTGGGSDQAINTLPGKAAFNSIDHQRSSPIFATASNQVQIWDESKTSPISNLTFPTSTETVTSVRFNLSERSILATVGSDRTFALYDIRTSKPERRIVMQMRANALSWSPTMPTLVLLASEDHNLYTFDIRHLSEPRTEFVSGGWDRTVRIWQVGQEKPLSIFIHRVTSTLFTTDARFVLSGSDDGNVRIWKAKASDKLGIVASRERASMEYRSSLINRWKVDKEVGKIARTRYLPKPVYSAAKLKNTMLQARRVKEERRRKHTRAGESKPKAERKKVVLAEQS